MNTLQQVALVIVVVVAIATIIQMIRVECCPLGGGGGGTIEIWRPSEPTVVFSGTLIGFSKWDTAERWECLLYQKTGGGFVYVEKHFPVNYGGRPDSVSVTKYENVAELAKILKSGERLDQQALEDAARKNPEIKSILFERL